MSHHPMRSRKFLLAGACALVISACATTSPVPPLAQTDVPGAFEQPTATAAPIWPQPDWWRGFASRELDGLIAAAQTQNLDLAAAETRILQAEARIRQAGSALLPTVSIGGDTSVQAEGGGIPAGLTFGASYEFDFWGRNRSLLASAEASGRATRADRETVALTAIASTASTYFQLLSLRERIEIARLNLENALTVLQVTESRVTNGIASALELAQQRATIAGQRAQIPALEQQELETRAALALLLGRPPEGFDVAARDLMAIQAPSVAPGLPSELLVRRPDIVTAEANLEGANANLAVARAALLPSIALTASGGVSSGTLTGLVTNPIFTAGIGLSLAQTIFDAGAREAATDEARAREQELLLSYRSVAITAFSEVETTLGSIANLNAQQMFQAEQVTQAEIAFTIAEARYREGVDDFLVVLEAQRSLYGARDQFGQTRLQQLLALVALYRVLGGGWEDPTANLAQQQP
jgi:NodT family efflux transporter outer membrane factor (OMF) lipoprotein